MKINFKTLFLTTLTYATTLFSQPLVLAGPAEDDMLASLSATYDAILGRAEVPGSYFDFAQDLTNLVIDWAQQGLLTVENIDTGLKDLFDELGYQGFDDTTFAQPAITAYLYALRNANMQRAAQTARFLYLGTLVLGTTAATAAATMYSVPKADGLAKYDAYLHCSIDGKDFAVTDKNYSRFSIENLEGVHTVYLSPEDITEICLNEYSKKHENISEEALEEIKHSITLKARYHKFEEAFGDLGHFVGQNMRALFNINGFFEEYTLATVTTSETPAIEGSASKTLTIGK